MATVTPEEVVRLIRRLRLPLSDERRCQAAISEALTAAGIANEREVRLGPGDVIDVYVPDGGVGIEVKVKGGRRAIHDQCARYCGHDAIRHLVLATAVATGFPRELGGKPCYVASLGRGAL